ncbi:hypothetical protein HAX54_028537, partial [Datura stramonium]|nr:hypothetical protein [Datura stramonium]
MLKTSPSSTSPNDLSCVSPSSPNKISPIPMEKPVPGSSVSSMVTILMSLSPRSLSIDSLNSASTLQFDLKPLIADIRSQYTSYQSPPSSPTSSSKDALQDLDVELFENTQFENIVSLSDSSILEDLVPLAYLKKDAQNCTLFSAPTTIPGTKLPCHFGPASRTRAIEEIKGKP